MSLQRILLFFVAASIGGLPPMASVKAQPTGNTVGLTFDAEGASSGYTLFSPHASTDAYLLDLQGRIVHRWRTPYFPGNSAYLLPDGHLLRAARSGDNRFIGGGRGGRIEEYDWDGNLVWGFDYSTESHRQHHDAIKLPNGNVLFIAWERVSREAAIDAGRDPALLAEGELWPDTLIEVAPVGDAGGTIVWKWHAWDHLVQDYDPSKDNFGVVADHPGRIDINHMRDRGADWLHINSVDYNPELDQIMISSPYLNEVWVIDHSTTTQEAAGSTGGKSGRGGDLLYRWGNPLVSKSGPASEQLLFAQHQPHWIADGLPGAGKVLVLNNGSGRSGDAYSTVDEFEIPLGSNYSYARDERPTLTWRYGDHPADTFFAPFVSNAQRLPNGNTLICNGPSGVIFEVTPQGNKVWEYVTPVVPGGYLAQGETPPARNLIFRAHRYPPLYSGLVGRRLTQQGTLEQTPDAPFQLIDVKRVAEGFFLRWSSRPGIAYEILYQSHLGKKQWESVGRVEAIGSEAIYLDQDRSRLEQSQGFYRVNQVP